MTFDEIVDSISPKEFKAVLLRGQYEELKRRVPNERINSWIQGIKKELSDEELNQNKNMDALTNIAYFARAISEMHPGWEEWDKYPSSKNDKEFFKKSIESLYNQQSSLDKEKRLKENELLAELYKIAGVLKDNHLEVFATQQKPNGGIHYYHPIGRATKLKYRPEPKGNVGRNLAFSEDFRREDRHTRVFNLETGPLVIAERIINGKKTGVIGLSTCFIQQGSPQEASQRHAFSEIVKSLQNNLKNWDNIILDVRGNSGGVPDYLQQIAETICGCKEGEKLSYCSESRPRETEEAKLRHQFYYKPHTQQRNSPKSYKGKAKLFVLTDRETSSSGEFVYPLFKQYQGTKFIGENTKGCCQYGEVSHISLPCGGAIQMGNVFNDFGNDLIEENGHKPDINCLGRDAFQEACKKIGTHTLPKTLSEGEKEGRIFLKWTQKLKSWFQK